MFGQRWEVPGVGQVSLVEARGEIAIHADELWPLLRLFSDAHRHWRWARLIREKPERFALLDRWGNPVAFWCSGMKRPLKLPEALCYRLDYVEIHPELRGGALGHFTFALVAARALETGSNGLVLGAIPAVQKFYLNAGGQHRLVGGWQAPRGLLPFFFDQEALKHLKEMADAYLDKG